VARVEVPELTEATPPRFMRKSELQKSGKALCSGIWKQAFCIRSFSKAFRKASMLSFCEAIFGGAASTCDVFLYLGVLSFRHGGGETLRRSLRRLVLLDRIQVGRRTTFDLPLSNGVSSEAAEELSDRHGRGEILRRSLRRLVLLDRVLVHVGRRPSDRRLSRATFVSDWA